MTHPIGHFQHVFPENMTTQELRSTYQELVETIVHHNRLYYELGTSEISDGEYDTLYRLLCSIEKEHPELISPSSPTKQVGAIAIADGFAKAAHPVPLISLSNSYSAQDIDAWHTQLKRIADKEGIDDRTYIVEPKLDGSSVEIVYQAGTFIQAITRGNGVEGEDITANVKMLRNLPLYVESFRDIQEIRLRGEIVLPQTSFDRLNQQQAERGEALFANPRNAAAGSLRQLDSSIVFERGLIIFVYDILQVTGKELEYTTDEQQLAWLKKCGIPVYPRHRICQKSSDVIKHCENKELIKELEDANTEMDGLVIKVHEVRLREIFGETEHHPRRAMAFKFPTKQVAARIHDITYQVGRTGAITPVAEIEPVELGGVTISRATLHNFDYIADRDIRKGDRVWIQRSGEVIPYIIGPIESRRTGEEEKISHISTCPSCKHALSKVEGEVALICQYQNCEAKLVQQVQHFVGKNSLDIAGLGKSIVQMLVEQGYVSSIDDLYHLTSKQLELKSLPGMGEKKITTITYELEESKQKPLRRWIHGFGIKFIGKKISQDLSAGFTKRLEAKEPGTSFAGLFLAFACDDGYLETLFGLGKQSILSLSDRASNKKNIDLIHSLESHGVYFGPEKAKEAASSHLAGISFVITGSFDGLTREELGERIKKHGGSLSSSISKKTSYLLAGEKAGSKVQKAQEAGVPILSIESFGELIGETFDQKKNSTGASQGSLFG